MQMWYKCGLKKPNCDAFSIPNQNQNSCIIKGNIPINGNTVLSNYLNNNNKTWVRKNISGNNITNVKYLLNDEIINLS